MTKQDIKQDYLFCETKRKEHRKEGKEEKGEKKGSTERKGISDEEAEK